MNIAICLIFYLMLISKIGRVGAPLPSHQPLFDDKDKNKKFL
jgi:hypothetical protein